MFKLGDLLRNTRKEKGIVLSQASEKTKIPIKYIKSLERGSYDTFVSEVHLKGFLKNYAKFLGIDTQKVLALYRRERMDIKDETLTQAQKPLQEPKALITPGRLVFIASILIIFMVIGFIVTQVHKILQPPQLSIFEPTQATAPAETIIEVTTPSITIAGSVEVGSELLINGNEVTTNNLQEFRVDNYRLNPGSNEVVIIAQSLYFSKASKIGLTIVYKENADQQTSTSDESMNNTTQGGIPVEKMIIEIEIGSENAWLKATTDGVTKIEETATSSQRFTLEAGEIFTIYSPRPQMIKLHINGEEFSITSQTVTIFRLVNGMIVEE